MGTQHCIIGRVRHAGTHTRAAQGAEIAAREASQRPGRVKPISAEGRVKPISAEGRVKPIQWT